MDMNMNELVSLVKTVSMFFMDHGRASDVTVKGRADFVTQVDLSVQNYMKEELAKRWPQIQFMGEEQDNSRIDFSGAVWILDPVDGTTNLIHDLRCSALSLALCEGGTVTAGVIYQPFSEELFVAQKGKGAYCNDRPIHVSLADRLEDSVIAVGTSPYHRELTEDNFAAIRRIYESCVDIRRMGAASIDLAYVACGRLEGYFERNLKPWDFAAGKLLVEEAGGTVMNLSGEPVSPLKAADVIAGNGRIDEMLRKKILDF